MGETINYAEAFKSLDLAAVKSDLAVLMTVLELLKVRELRKLGFCAAGLGDGQLPVHAGAFRR